MKCLTPVVRSVVTKYKSNKHGAIFPDKTMYVLCPCGKCVPCLLAEQNDWSLRLQLQAEVSSTAWFVTLTFSDENLPSDKGVHKSDIQRFMNTLRKKMERIYKELGAKPPHLLYFAVGEYGRKGARPHYHLVIYNMPAHSIIEMYNVCNDVWNRGFVKVEFLCPENCRYVAKYMTKLDPRPHATKPFRLMSRRPALGFEYFEKPQVREYLNRDGVFLIHTRSGHSYRIPRTIKRKFICVSKLQSMKEHFAMDEEQVLMNAREFNDYVAVGQAKNERLMQRIKARFI